VGKKVDDEIKQKKLLKKTISKDKNVPQKKVDDRK